MRVVMKGRVLWLMMRITSDALYCQWLSGEFACTVI
jgi:hypothetical protein